MQLAFSVVSLLSVSRETRRQCRNQCLGFHPSRALMAAKLVKDDGVHDLTAYVQNLLQQMQDKFQGMSDQIVTRIDEMGGRIDELEKALSDLMTQAGVDESGK